MDRGRRSQPLRHRCCGKNLQNLGQRICHSQALSPSSNRSPVRCTSTLSHVRAVQSTPTSGMMKRQACVGRPAIRNSTPTRATGRQARIAHLRPPAEDILRQQFVTRRLPDQRGPTWPTTTAGLHGAVFKPTPGRLGGNQFEVKRVPEKFSVDQRYRSRRMRISFENLHGQIPNIRSDSDSDDRGSRTERHATDKVCCYGELAQRRKRCVALWCFLEQMLAMSRYSKPEVLNPPDHLLRGSGAS